MLNQGRNPDPEKGPGKSAPTELFSDPEVRALAADILSKMMLLILEKGGSLSVLNIGGLPSIELSYKQEVIRFFKIGSSEDYDAARERSEKEGNRGVRTGDGMYAFVGALTEAFRADYYRKNKL